MITHVHSSLIDFLGGTSVVAELCEVRSQAVSQWRRTGIPRARLKFIQVAKAAAFATWADTENRKKAA